MKTTKPTTTRSTLAGPPKSPEELAAPGWRKTRAGLFWVLFALFFLALPGFVGFAKAVCIRANVELPHGKGFISIPGVLNGEENETFQMDAAAQVDALAYGAPILLAGLALVLGRLTCGAAPRSSGAKGMFVFSGLFTLLALGSLVVAAVCRKVLNYDAEVKIQELYRYTALGFVLLIVTAEFWFLTALAASGATLKRPKAPRAVGLIGFFGALIVAFIAVGWEQYEHHLRPKVLTEDWKMYEQAALMLAWLLVIGLYWRAVGAVRGAIRDFLDTVP